MSIEKLVRLSRIPRFGEKRTLFAWGFVDQGFSSATTFTFTVIAARNLGPAGLGTVALGYAAFLVASGFERSLIIDPLITRIETSAWTTVEALRAAISATLLGGLLFAFLALIVGLALSGAGSRGMLIFAPWLPPALMYGLLRAWLYRVNRGDAATASNVVWLLTMLAAVGLGLRSSDWEITAAWGLGACAALAVAAACTRNVGLASPRAALAWFLHEALGLGIWRSASSIVFMAALYARASGISSILGPAAVGGYRAVETAFAPTTLIGSALGNPGLPTMRDAVEQRASEAWGLAVKISMLSFGVVLAYVVTLYVGRDLVFRVFGAGFRQYEYLIIPIGVGQLINSVGAGFSILLLGARRMRDTAFVIVVFSSLQLALALPLAAVSGLKAAAWGISLAEIPPLILVMAFAHRAVRKSALNT